MHEVDFTPVALRPRRVVHIQPGQIHRWRFADPYQATLVFFPDTTAMRAAGWPVGPRWFDLDDTEWTNTMSVLSLTRSELQLKRSPARRDRALNGALELLIVNLGLDLPRHQDPSRLPKPYVELLNQLEDDPDWSRSVTRRAQRLGYSQRTLTRSCLATTGRTAKETIDDRVLLEAQRLLVDGDPAISTVAAQLGFSEPANFTRFFQRLTGESPATWHAHTQTRQSAIPTGRERAVLRSQAPDGLNIGPMRSVTSGRLDAPS